MLADKFAKREVVDMIRLFPTSTATHQPKTINLSSGDPDFNQPELICRAVYDALKSGHSHYVHGGDPELKYAIADYYKKYGVDVEPRTQVLITSGGDQAVFQSFGSILNPGDEVLIMDPAYQGYVKPAAYFGSKLTRAKRTKDETGLYRPNMDNIDKSITDRTKAILICNPDNPVGTVYTQKELEEISRIAVEKDILVIADEIYTEYIWGKNKHRPIINMPGMEDRTLVLMSFSKTFAWTGCRCGYIIAGTELIEMVSKVHVGVCGVPVAFQKAGIVALEQGWDFVNEMRETFKKRIDYMVPRLNEIDGIRCPYPEGAFYLFVDVSDFGIPCSKFAAEFHKQERVRLAPGTRYGEGGEGNLRFALVRPIKDLEEVANRFERFVKNLK